MYMPLRGLHILKWLLPASLVLATCCSGCKKLVQVDTPDDLLDAAHAFSNDSLAQAAVTGIYIKIMSSTKYLLNGGVSVYAGLSADEITRTVSMPNEDQFGYNTLLSNNQLVGTNLWKTAYACIYQCNICIEQLQKSNGVTAALKKQLTGQVQFVRALCYYYLVNLYGEVPLALTTNADANAILPRSAETKVYEQITADLQSAALFLTGDVANTLPSRFAAQALLARVYLHRGYWGGAEAAATTVINSGKYQLPNDLNSVFKATSPEVIFQWAPVVQNFNSVEGNSFIPASQTATPVYIIMPSLVASFETGDLRKENWLKEAKAGNQTIYYPYKYKVRVSPAPTEYNIVLRLGEVYLVRAEARMEQKRIADAVSDINVVRNRAGISPVSDTISYDQCAAAIEQERRTELFTEWGHRWIDLKRTKRADAVLSIIKGSNWQSTDHLYPIPLSEIETDPYLKQNPGYE
jgi:starch-binding outer membrane protein, SusD/RagB family